MTLEDLKEYFGNSNQFELQTGMSHGNWSYWRKNGFISYSSQIKIEYLTKGKLKASLDHVPEHLVMGSYKKGKIK